MRNSSYPAVSYIITIDSTVIDLYQLLLTLSGRIFAQTFHQTDQRCHYFILCYRYLVESDPAYVEDDFEPPNDNMLEEMEERLESFMNDKEDIEKVRSFSKDVKTSHLGTREQIGDIIRQLL